MVTDQAEAAVSEIELWAESIEQTGNYFPQLERRAVTALEQPMPTELRNRFFLAIERISAMRSAKRH